jgi:Bacterial Ig-like domain
MIAGQAFAATSLSTPGSLAPNSAAVAQKDPVLSWGSVSGATGYQVELSKSSDWSDDSELVALPDQGAASTASYAVPQTLVHGVYFWRVRAADSSDKSSWSANAQLDRAWTDAPSTTGSTPSADPTVTQAGGIASYPERFAWKPMPDASSYEMEFSSSSTFPQGGSGQGDNNTPGTVNCLTTATSWTPYGTATSTPDINVDDCDASILLSAGPVFWRVRGVDDSTSDQLAAASQKDSLECAGVPTVVPNGDTTATALGSPTSPGQECSDWSATSVATGSTLPAGTATAPGAVTPVALNCPAGTSSDFACTTTPEISWQPTAGAVAYAVTIADDSSFTNVERAYTSAFLSLTPRDQLADYTAGKGYYVAVQACNSDTTCGAATVKSFTIQTTAVTGLSATKVTGGVRLSWNDLESRFAATTGAPAIEAENYKVQVAKATDPQFDNPVGTTTVDASCDATVNSCYSPPAITTVATDQTVVAAPATGSFIWRVLPVDLTGNVLPAAADATAFTVDLTRPAFHLSTKSGVAVTGPLGISASEAVTGVSASTVHVVPQGKGVASAVAGKLTAGSAPNTWEFTPSAPLATGGSYVLSVASTVTDQSGNTAVVTGSAVRTTKDAKNTSKGWTYSAGWKKHTASGALSGSYRSAKTGKTAHVKVVGSKAELFACKSPAMGKVKITVGGHSKTVSEHQAFTRCGVEIWHGALAAGDQTITVKVLKAGKDTGNVDEVTVS